MSTAKDPHSLKASASQSSRESQAELHDAFDLWGFLQIACSSGRRAAFRLNDGYVEGTLYFDRGELVHATCGQLSGDSAAIALLTHRDASCQRVQGEWRERRSVETSLSGLLLRAVGEIEAPGGRVPRAPRNSTVRPVSRPRPKESTVVGRPASGPEQGQLTYADFDNLAWIDARGEVLKAHGNDAAFAANAAHAVRVAELLGQLLSLGDFLALDCRDRAGDRIAYRDGKGGLVACVPSSPEVASRLRSRLGMP